MGRIRPTSGGAEIFGRDPQRDAGIAAEIGYLPGELALYEDMPGWAPPGWLGRLRGQ
jgi:ABC-2 type transport system ATP-binding protein